VLSALAPALAHVQAGRPVLPIDDRCNDLLRQALENKNPDARKQAVVALSQAATDEPAFGKLEEMLQGKDVEVRLAVVASLAEVKTAVARAALRQALDDDVPEVGFVAAKALWAIEDQAGEQALLAILGRQTKASSNYISKQRRDALRMLQTPRVLFLCAFRQGIGFVPVAALRDDPTLKIDLEPVLDDDKAPVRLRAAAGILWLSAIEEKQAKKKQRKTSVHASVDTAR